MQIIETPDGNRYEVLKQVSEEWLKYIGQEKAQKFLDNQFLADVILKHPQQPLYILGREIVDVEYELNPIDKIVPKRKRGRPKGSKNKPKKKIWQAFQN